MTYNVYITFNTVYNIKEIHPYIKKYKGNKHALN